MSFFEKIIYSLHYRLNSLNKVRITGQNNRIERNARLEGVRILIQGNNNEIIISPGAILRFSDIRVLGNNHKILIGENCDVQKNEIWLQGENCLLSIGKNSMVVHSDIAVGENGSKLIIGENCMVASEIRTSDGHSILNPEMQRVNFAKDIIIEDQVWVCKGSMVLKGVRIGKGSMVAARSMVTCDIPEYSLAAGTPAKVIRTPVAWDRKLI
jgi:acetyltransferase-like isoleucine patch superfamily enzyme